MNKMILALSVLLAGGTSMLARADVSAQLSDFNTDNCGAVIQDDTLLNNAEVTISPSCSEAGYFQSSNGQGYTYRVYTNILVRGAYAGETIQLSEIDTNDCNTVANRVRSLSTQEFTLVPSCTAAGQYVAPSNGQVYAYRVFTTLIVNY